VGTEDFSEKEISSAKEFYMLFLKDKCDRRKKKNKKEKFHTKNHTRCKNRLCASVLG